jgi:hypothetical protein
MMEERRNHSGTLARGQKKKVSQSSSSVKVTTSTSSEQRYPTKQRKDMEILAN